MKNIGVLIYTHNRVDDARVNMEIIRNVWEQPKYFEDVTIVHAFNGEKEWYPKKYLENDLIRIKNSWHFQGASDLIDAGMACFQKKYKHLDYVVVLASDTWLIKPAYIKKLLEEIRKGKYYLATCPWGLPEHNKIQEMAKVGMATDFFIVDLKWAKENEMFPIRYQEFYKKYSEIILYQFAGNVHLEKLLLARYTQAINREECFGGVAKMKTIEKTYILKERMPVHSYVEPEGNWVRNMYWSEIGLLTHHEAQPKKDILLAKGITVGENIKKLLESEDVSYFNNGITKSKEHYN